MKLIRDFSALVILIGMISCDISENKIEPEKSFVRIYDDNTFESSFIPIDVKQTEDEGYVILGARRLEDSDFVGVYLLRVDKEGNFVAENQLSEDLLQPVNNLMKIDGNFYFIAMSNISLQANLVSVNPDSLNTGITALGGLTYPLYAKDEGSEIVFLSYDNDNKTTVLSSLNSEGAVTGQEEFTIGAGNDVEAPIIEHFTRTGKQLPFFAGKANGAYYFNGFYNYTISMVFTDLNDSGADGVVQGQQDDGGLSAAVHLDGSNFALSRFNFGDNYIHPTENISFTGTTSSVDMEGNPFPELISDAPVVVKKIEVNNEDVTLYASNTRSKQIVLLAYDNNGELLGSQYFGHSAPYEVAGFTQTEDGGLAIVGTVYVAGRFARICLIKISKEELVEFAQ